MKIGLLSMQRVVNYGSFWQAYLLKLYFTSLGNKVEFIDIIPGKQLYDYPKKGFKISNILYYLSRSKYYLGFSRKQKRIFASYLEKYLSVSSIPNYSADYDCIIIGSDEVFNFAQPTSWGFSPQLHGAIDNDNVSSYAGSFGTSTFEEIEKYGIREELIEAMSNLKHISVRDENSYNITRKILPEARIFRHLDPVLVEDLPVPEKQKVSQKYIAIYSYSFRFKDKPYIKEIREFAKKNGYTIYSLGSYQTWVDKNINVDPFELLQYFVNAEYIVTDTFHGTIFSVRCHKKFAVIVRDGNRQKLSSLLIDLNLEDRLLSRADNIERILETEIEYGKIDKLLYLARKQTNEYLQSCLY